ncbi:MAG: hypothetical protein WCK86_02555 [Planctomycetia bacterium]
MSRARHSKPAVEKAIQYAEQLGWSVELSNGHAWGRLYCPFSTREGCIISVWSTPRSPDNHARQIRKKVDSCPHSQDSGDDSEGESES